MMRLRNTLVFSSKIVFWSILPVRCNSKLLRRVCSICQGKPKKPRSVVVISARNVEFCIAVDTANVMTHFIMDLANNV